MEILRKYFSNLTEEQFAQFEQLVPLYKDWNEKINVISRKDIDNLELRHILHSLSIAKFVQFRPGSEILDLGTGGGFPGIPLAIYYPDVQFTLVDSRGKKITVVNEIIQALGLKNVTAIHGRAEEIKNQKFDFVVTRAVAKLEQLVRWCMKLVKTEEQNGLPNGLIALKGGKLKGETKALGKHYYSEYYKVQKFFKDDYFAEKFVVYVQR